MDVSDSVRKYTFDVSEFQDFKPMFSKKDLEVMGKLVDKLKENPNPILNEADIVSSKLFRSNCVDYVTVNLFEMLCELQDKVNKALKLTSDESDVVEIHQIYGCFLYTLYFVYQDEGSFGQVMMSKVLSIINYESVSRNRRMTPTSSPKTLPKSQWYKGEKKNQRFFHQVRKPYGITIN